MKTLVVAAGIVERDGRILITRRLAGHLAGLWEFPGGKVEPGETIEACLTRELEEELGLLATVNEKVLATTHDYPDRRVELHFLRCHTTSEPEPRLGQEMRWATRQELGELPFPPADSELIEILTGERAG